MYPFDFNTKPKIIDVIGIGVNKKNNHIFSTNSPFAFDTAPTKTNAPIIDKRDATNKMIDAVLHLFEIWGSIIFKVFLYINE